MIRICNVIRQFKKANFKWHIIETQIRKIPRKLEWKRIRKSVELSRWQYAIGKDERHDEKIMISLTTYPARYSCVVKTLKSIALQTMKPDKICIWIFNGDGLPDDHKLLEKYGIEFHLVNENLRSHNKYFFAMQEYPEYSIITIDDDCYYPKDLVECLWKTHQKYPDCICARRVHKMVRKDGFLAPYITWGMDWRHDYEPRHDLIATGIGGVYYPASIMPRETFNKMNIIDTSLYADDIWLKAMELIHSIKVVWAPCSTTLPGAVKESQKSNLYSNNVDKNKNDEAIRKIEERYFGIWNKIN